MNRKPIKKLNLVRETVRTLGNDELGDVAGGTSVSTVVVTAGVVSIVSSVVYETAAHSWWTCGGVTPKY